MKHITRLILILSLWAVAPSCVPAQGQDFVILFTNDIHSQIEPFTSGRDAGKGGLLAMSDYIEQVRRETPAVLYLDAGDYNQGTPYYNLFGGELEIAYMNAVGLNATTLGNHEFDNGLDNLAKRLKKANYTTLCANYTINHAALRKIVKPYAIFEVGGHKVGVIGLTVNLKGLCSAEVINKMHYNDPTPIANELARKLRKKGCDYIVCLTHLGIEQDLELAGKISGIDAIIGGHSHTFMDEPQMVEDLDGKQVPVIQTGAKGVYVGRMDVTF